MRHLDWRCLEAAARQRVVRRWPTGGAPVLVPCPTVPALLLQRTPEASFQDARAALVELAQAMVDRVNLVVPMARALAASAATRHNA